MRFYDREKELNVLEKAFERPGSDLLLLTGRRRVGKSRLVEEFIKGKNALSLSIVPKEEKQVAKDLEEEIRLKLGYSPAFSKIKDALEYVFQKEASLVFFDEFPNTLKVNKSIPFELQKLWDEYKDKKDILLVITGSYISMTEKLFTSKKAPLFNRATNTISLSQLNYQTVFKILEDLGIADEREQIAHYCIFGGVPYYYLLLEKEGTKTIQDSINALFFDEGAQLKEEGENVLKQEFGNAYSKYYAILESIQAGRVSMNEICQALGMRSTILSKYLNSLQKKFKIVERTVPFGENQYKSKKGSYSIKDNTLAFWFTHVYGKSNPPSNESLNAFIGKRFEALCKEALKKLVENQGETVLKTGDWRGGVEIKEKFEQREVDLVIETDKRLYVGECKWTERTPGQKQLEDLKQSAKAITSKTRKPVVWALFSKNGSDIPKQDDVLELDARKIAKIS